MKSDALLIDETLSGDSSAYGQLVLKYQDRLFNSLAYLDIVSQVRAQVLTPLVENEEIFVDSELLWGDLGEKYPLFKSELSKAIRQFEA
mgnify:CR=1 FL=1